MNKVLLLPIRIGKALQTSLTLKEKQVYSLVCERFFPGALIRDQDLRFTVPVPFRGDTTKVFAESVSVSKASTKGRRASQSELIGAIVDLQVGEYKILPTEALLAPLLHLIQSTLETDVQTERLKSIVFLYPATLAADDLFSGLLADFIRDTEAVVFVVNPKGQIRKITRSSEGINGIHLADESPIGEGIYKKALDAANGRFIPQLEKRIMQTPLHLKRVRPPNRWSCVHSVFDFSMALDPIAEIIKETYILDGNIRRIATFGDESGQLNLAARKANFEKLGLTEESFLEAEDLDSLKAFCSTESTLVLLPVIDSGETLKKVRNAIGIAPLVVALIATETLDGSVKTIVPLTAWDKELELTSPFSKSRNLYLLRKKRREYPQANCLLCKSGVEHQLIKTSRSIDGSLPPHSFWSMVDDAGFILEESPQGNRGNFQLNWVPNFSKMFEQHSPYLGYLLAAIVARVTDESAANSAEELRNSVEDMRLLDEHAPILILPAESVKKTKANERISASRLIAEHMEHTYKLATISVPRKILDRVKRAMDQDVAGEEFLTNRDRKQLWYLQLQGLVRMGNSSPKIVLFDEFSMSGGTLKVLARLCKSLNLEYTAAAVLCNFNLKLLTEENQIKIESVYGIQRRKVEVSIHAH
jgi:hypothetical protein